MTSPRKTRRNDPAPQRWIPLTKFDEGEDKAGHYRRWENDRYRVTERHGHTMIVNMDQSARRDFRDFQAIKNQLWGDEAEAVEIYPAESRLQDPSNAFFLWRVRNMKRRLGINTRRNVLTHKHALAPQRDFE